MTPLQSKLLEMMTWLDRFIRENRLTYYVIGGTLIGAARHQGFIPWDDDVDIAMPRKDYDKLCALLKKPVSHYVVEAPDSEADDFLYTFAKFYDTNTSMAEHLKKDVKRGIYIDIFPLDGIGQTYEEALKNYQAIDRKNMLLMTRVCAYRKERKWYKNAAIFAARLIPGFLLNEKKLTQEIDRLNRRIPFETSEYISLTMSTYRARDIHKRSLLGTPVELPFENITVLAPQHYDQYLADTFGDWRKLPPEEKRKCAHDFVDLDFDRPYMKTEESDQKAGA